MSILGITVISMRELKIITLAYVLQDALGAATGEGISKAGGTDPST